MPHDSILVFPVSLILNSLIRTVASVPESYSVRLRLSVTVYPVLPCIAGSLKYDSVT